MATKRLRSDDDIMLIGSIDHQITGAKLPSRKQVLQVLFYNLRIVGLNLRESTRLAVAEVSTFWQKARIPTHHEKRSIEKLEQLYNEWRSITKNHGRKTETQNRNETDFQEQLDDLFDIAHADAVALIKIQEDKEFFLKQREKGRPGCMLGTDKIVQKEQENQHNIKEDKRKELYEQQAPRAMMDLDDIKDIEVVASPSAENVKTNESGKTPSVRRGKRQNIGRHTKRGRRTRMVRQKETEEEAAQRIERSRLYGLQMRAAKKSSQQDEPVQDGKTVQIMARKEVEEKIKAGTYKLRIDPHRRNTLWKIFATVAKEDGSVLDGYVGCIECEQLYRYSGKSTVILRRHICFLVSGQTKVDGSAVVKGNENEEELHESSDTSAESLLVDREPSPCGDMLSRDEVETNLENGNFELTDRPSGKSLIWSLYAKIAKKKSGAILDTWVYCRQCKNVLKYNGVSTSNFYRHICYLNMMKDTRSKRPREDGEDDEDDEEDEKLSETSVENDTSPPLEMDIRTEVISKLKSGQYNIIHPSKSNKPIWSLFAKITNEAGSILDDWVYCRQCKNLSKYNGISTANFYRHKCYLKMLRRAPPKKPETEMDIIKKNVKKNIRSGCYRLMRNKMPSSSIWFEFSFILKPDQSILPGLVQCRRCNMSVDYDGESVANLKLHKCLTPAREFKGDVVPVQGIGLDSTKDVNAGINAVTLESDEPVSICVKEEIEETFSL